MQNVKSSNTILKICICHQSQRSISSESYSAPSNLYSWIKRDRQWKEGDGNWWNGKR